MNIKANGWVKIYSMLEPLEETAQQVYKLPMIGTMKSMIMIFHPEIAEMEKPSATLLN